MPIRPFGGRGPPVAPHRRRSRSSSVGLSNAWVWMWRGSIQAFSRLTVSPARPRTPEIRITTGSGPAWRSSPSERQAGRPQLRLDPFELPLASFSRSPLPRTSCLPCVKGWHPVSIPAALPSSLNVGQLKNHFLRPPRTPALAAMPCTDLPRKPLPDQPDGVRQGDDPDRRRHAGQPGPGQRAADTGTTMSR